MTKSLTQAVSKLRELSKEKQEGAAELLLDYVYAAEQNIGLTDEQLAEVRRRRAERKPKTISLKQLDVRLKRLRA